MKAPEAFRGISEVADAIGVRQHTLRAWETRFAFVKPVKRPDGRRYYRPADIAMLRELKRLIEGRKAFGRGHPEDQSRRGFQVLSRNRRNQVLLSLAN